MTVLPVSIFDVSEERWKANTFAGGHAFFVLTTLAVAGTGQAQSLAKSVVGVTGCPTRTGTCERSFLVGTLGSVGAR